MSSSVQSPLRRIMVVDPSKVVRATLSKHLRDQFEVREEDNGDSAWQTLILDSTIVAVISGAQLPKLDGYQLLENLRSNRLRRLSDMPFLLVVSGNETTADRLRAKEKGVTDFITRGMPKTEIVERVMRLANWEFALSTHVGIDPDAIRESKAEKSSNKAAKTATGDFSRKGGGLLSRSQITKNLGELMSQPATTGGMVSVIKFGMDNFATLSGEMGQEAVQTIAIKLASVLKAKLGPRDLIGYGAPSQCVIVSPESSLATCVAFAQRVCRGFANAQVAYRGDPVELLVSAGVVNVPADGPLTAKELLALAARRLAEAQGQGGCRVVSEALPGENSGLLMEGSMADLVRQAMGLPPGLLGLQLMPALRLLDREFSLGLPLAQFEQRFALRAREGGAG